MARPSVLPSTFGTVSASGMKAFAVQWLAHAIPYRRFADILADACARLGADADRSGRIEARTGLRMMPTSPRSPLSFRTAGFPQYGGKAGLSGGAFPSPDQLKPAPGMRWSTPGLHPPCVHLVASSVVPL